MVKNLMPGVALIATLSFGAATAFGAADPPGRVGRLSYVEGTASFHTVEQSDWSPVALNYPIVAGQSFWTEPQSRLELQIGSTEVRLDEATALDIVALDDRATQLWLP